jgi:hypothetical protein
MLSSLTETYLSINLVIVVVLLITTLWTSQTGPPVGEPRATQMAARKALCGVIQTDSPAGEPRATALTTERGVGDAPVAACCNLDRVPLRSFAWPPQRDRRPFRDLQATLCARYAAQWEQAIRTIGVGPYAVARPTDQTAGEWPSS